MGSIPALGTIFPIFITPPTTIVVKLLSFFPNLEPFRGEGEGERGF